jgi:hypothetical protein
MMNDPNNDVLSVILGFVACGVLLIAAYHIRNAIIDWWRRSNERPLEWWPGMKQLKARESYEGLAEPYPITGDYNQPPADCPKTVGEAAAKRLMRRRRHVETDA